jgi:hypothetical protein
MPASACSDCRCCHPLASSENQTVPIALIVDIAAPSWILIALHVTEDPMSGLLSSLSKDFMGAVGYVTFLSLFFAGYVLDDAV